MPGTAGVAESAPDAAPPVRYRVTSARIRGGMAMRGITVPGTTRCGFSITASISAGVRREIGI